MMQGWDFPAEEAAPTWAQDIATQAPELLLFAAFATLALVGFFRKSERLKWITLGVAVVYLGFARSQLISVVNIFGLTSLNLPVFRYNLAWYFFAIFTVVTTILWGRLYCGRICAFGALTQLMDRIVPAKLRVEVRDGSSSKRARSSMRCWRSLSCTTSVRRTFRSTGMSNRSGCFR